MSNWMGGWFGDSSSGAACDYPAVGDVQSGVVYNNGDSTGTLVLPAAGNVLSGTGYGASGTEFTGTLSCGGTEPDADIADYSPADITSRVLIALGVLSAPDDGLSWPCFVNGEPPDPDNIVTVYDTAGSDDGRSMIDGSVLGHYGINIRIRATKHTTGWNKARTIFDAISNDVYQHIVTIGAVSYLVWCFSKIGDILSVGKEPNSQRNIFTLNALISVKVIE